MPNGMDSSIHTQQRRLERAMLTTDQSMPRYIHQSMAAAKTSGKPIFMTTLIRFFTKNTYLCNKITKKLRDYASS